MWLVWRLLHLIADGEIERQQQEAMPSRKEGAMRDRMLNKLSSASKDFPLIEVMVVIACIGILVTIALQKFLAH